MPRYAERGAGAEVIALPPSGLAEADDVALVRALLDHDPQAPRVLWNRFSPMVHRMLRRALGPGQDTEDVAQEVFLCVFEKIPAIREPKALKAFIISVTALTARHELRRRWVRRWVKLSGDVEPLDVGAVQPNSDAREALRRFYRILDRVNVTDRTVFTLRFIEGLELADVAAALGISLATTKRRLARAWARVSLLVQRDASLVDYLSERKPVPNL